MPAFLAKAGKLLIKYLASDPEKLLKFIFIALILPLALFVLLILAPLGILTHIPLTPDEKYIDYFEVVEEIQTETGVLVDWHYLVGIDAVLYSQDFSDIPKSHIEDIAWRFIEEREEEREREIEVEYEEEYEVEREITVSDWCWEYVTTPTGWSYQKVYCPKKETVTDTRTRTRTRTEIETYTVTVYELRPLDEVLDQLVADGLLKRNQIADVKRYIETSYTDETHSPNMNDIPMVTDGTFMRPATGKITSGYGGRWGKKHAGVDIGAGGRSGVPIVATAAGVVARSYTSTSYGECIIIRHNVNGQVYESLYAHMERGSRRYKTGDSVSKGSVIGIMGNTGNSFGAHLHFELHQGTWNSKKSNSVNPVQYIQF